jgi:chaperonin GroES
MHVTPLHDRVLVRRLEESEQKVGGIIVPDSAKEKPQQGQIVAVGKGRLNDKGQRTPLSVQVGDRILFEKYAQEVTLSGETYIILREAEVLAVLGGGETTKRTKAAKAKTKVKHTKTNAKTMKKGKTKKKRK